MEGQGRWRKVMDGHFPSLDWHNLWEKLGVSGWVGGGGGLQDYIVSPNPIPFPLDFGFWIWDLDLGPWFGTWIWNWIWAWQLTHTLVELSRGRSASIYTCDCLNKVIAKIIIRFIPKFANIIYAFMHLEVERCLLYSVSRLIDDMVNLA